LSIIIAGSAGILLLVGIIALMCCLRRKSRKDSNNSASYKVNDDRIALKSPYQVDMQDPYEEIPSDTQKCELRMSLSGSGAVANPYLNAPARDSKAAPKPVTNTGYSDTGYCSVPDMAGTTPERAGNQYETPSAMYSSKESQPEPENEYSELNPVV